MTTKDLAACSSDNASNLKLADDTINALSVLLKGIQLSEDHAAQILGAVRAITDEHSGMRLPMSQLPTSTDTISDTAAPSSGDVSPVQGQPHVDQEAPKIPSGHYVVTHNGINFVLPFKDQSEPFYLITKGKLVSVFSNWEKVSPLVNGVSCGTFCRLPVGTTIGQGRKLVERAIDDGVVKDVGKLPPATVEKTVL